MPPSNSSSTPWPGASSCCWGFWRCICIRHSFMMEWENVKMAAMMMRCIAPSSDSREGADVPVPYVVAGRPRQAPGRQRDPGRRPAQNGTYGILRISYSCCPPLRWIFPGGWRSYLGIVYGAFVIHGPDGFEENGGLFQRGSTWAMCCWSGAMNEIGFRAPLCRCLPMGSSRVPLLVGRGDLRPGPHADINAFGGLGGNAFITGA